MDNVTLMESGAESLISSCLGKGEIDITLSVAHTSHQKDH